MVVDLAKEMADFALSRPLGAHVCTYNQVFKLSGDWDERDCLENDIYMIYFRSILTRVNRMGSRFLDFDHAAWIDSTLDDLMDLRSAMDRLFELRALVDRAKAKVSNEAPAAQKLGSPLKVLK